MITTNVKKLNKLSILDQNRGQFLSLAVVLLSFFLFIGQAEANGLPAPTLLAPEATRRLGQDRVWVGGVAFNDSDITVLVDGEEKAKTSVRNHKSKVGSFGVELVNLGLGSHKVTAISHDSRGRDSIVSNELLINIEPKTPAPVVYKPVVNGDSGIERPFIVGNIQAGLEVKIVVDDRIVASVSPKIGESGIASFAWQPDKALALGQHKIEAFASDRGKLSNNSKPVYWQVGKAEEKKDEDKISQDSVVPTAGGDDTGISVIESNNGEQALTVTDKTEKIEEKPIIPDRPPVPPLELEPVVTEPGQIDTGEEINKEVAVNDQGDKVQELAPGAVVKQVANEEDSGFELNNSLIVGVAILIFLLLSMAVWYVQERKDKLGDKVVSMFKEPDTMSSGNQTSGRDRDDLPPPPPPVF